MILTGKVESMYVVMDSIDLHRRLRTSLYKGYIGVLSLKQIIKHQTVIHPDIAQLEEQPTVEYSLRGYRRVIGSIPVPGTKWHL